MVLANKVLFAAGPPDVVDPQDPMAAFEWRKGGLLYAYSADDGNELAQYKLNSPPVLDGLIAAQERLYLATVDGRVLCFGGEKLNTGE
jgi:outer membrane protein assembly factor BamB